MDRWRWRWGHSPHHANGAPLKKRKATKEEREAHPINKMPKRKNKPRAAEPVDATALKRKTVKQLRAMLKKAGLETTGRKAALVERLVAGLPLKAQQDQPDKQQVQAEAHKHLQAPQAVASPKMLPPPLPLPQQQQQQQQQQQGSRGGGGATPEMAQGEQPPATKKRKTQNVSVSNPNSSSSTSASAHTPSLAPTTFKGTAIQADRPLFVSELATDRVFACAQQFWRRDGVEYPALDSALIEHTFVAELGRGSSWYSRIMALDSMGYLDQYLWPLYADQSATDAHALSIMLLFNFRVAAGVPLFSALFEDTTAGAQCRQAKWSGLASHLLRIELVHPGMDSALAVERLVFFTHCAELGDAHGAAGAAARSICCLDVWRGALSERSIQQQVSKVEAPDKSRWQRVLQQQDPPPVTLIPVVAAEIADILCMETNGLDAQMQQPSTMVFCTEGLRLLIALLSRADTRPFLIPLLSDMAFAARLYVAMTGHPSTVLGHAAAEEHAAVPQLVRSLLVAMDAGTQAGAPAERRSKQVWRFEQLQSVAFGLRKSQPSLSRSNKNAHFLSQIALSTFRKGGRSSFIVRCLAGCERVTLLSMVRALGLSDEDTATKLGLGNDVLVELVRSFVNGHCPNGEVTEEGAAFGDSNGEEESAFVPPPHPVSGSDIWSTHVVPRGTMGSPALPRMQLSYHYFRSYLSESLHLHRLNLAANMRTEINNALATSSAVTLEEVSAISMRQPVVGATLPQQVLMDVIVSTADMDTRVRTGWDLHTRTGDTLVLLEVDASRQTAEEAGVEANRRGVQQARVATVVDILDDQGVSAFRKNRNTPLVGTRRTVRLSLSTAQYVSDMQQGREFAAHATGALNMVVRGSTKLSAESSLVRGLSKLLRDHISSSGAGRSLRFPSWLKSALVGMGVSNVSNSSSSSSSSAHALPPPPPPSSSYAFDTFNLFENEAHLEEVFGSELTLHQADDESDDEDMGGSGSLVSSTIPILYRIRSPMASVIEAFPYRAKKHQTNTPRLRGVRLSAAQGRAIVGAMRTGMTTLVEGGPGTGKSVIAACVASILARGGGSRRVHDRVLVIGNSDGVVDSILFKLVRELNVDPRHVVRLGRQGHGPGKFGAAGRRDHCLARQKSLLTEVSRLSVSLGVTSPDSLASHAPAFTCETADHFYKVHVGPRIRAFHESVDLHGGAHDPFVAYFRGAAAADGDDAERRFAHLRSMFLELRDYRALELLQNRRKQMDYVTCQLARVVVTSAEFITTAHERFEKLGFFETFDSVVVDGAEHIADAQLLLSLSLVCGVSVLSHASRADREGGEGTSVAAGRLARLLLVGDSNTGFPGAENDALGDGSKLRMSLFSRLSAVRKGIRRDTGATTTIQHFHLQHQWRARSSLADLFRWRYETLLDGNPTRNRRSSNPGFAMACQFVHVAPLATVGEVMVSSAAREEESCFHGSSCSRGATSGYQNLAEAEYMVAVYQFMRLIGYPAQRISILATHSAQCALIKDVLNLRCVPSPAYFGRPRCVSTAEGYAGQENDFVLLSLARTSGAKGLLSTERLLLALSRAKTGLYIFGSKETFSDCFRLTPVFSQFRDASTQLGLVAGEPYDARARQGAGTSKGRPFYVHGVVHMVSLVRKMLGGGLLGGVAVGSS